MERYGSLAYTEEQRRHWGTGQLADEWRRGFPAIFDDDDLRITRNQPRYHFFEWLAAIHIYTSIGWPSLVEKYRCTNHPRKLDLYNRLLPLDVQRPLDVFEGMMPDLLVYREDLSDFFFCEVKGRTDSLRQNQIEFFEAITQVTGKPVYLLEYWELKPGEPNRGTAGKLTAESIG